ncbi:hypothetical protein PoB_004557800 [Plakobranchus ocellatus]|uniref:Secreted protein n=1 Tax=Plakobranchus ocellatus TaxID=259542 RepID=A0AAV4BHJ3_9GAST|nr:hypothetical protein PoB_004557800 [Plakobranchus ocellatus]
MLRVRDGLLILFFFSILFVASLQQVGSLVLAQASRPSARPRCRWRDSNPRQKGPCRCQNCQGTLVNLCASHERPFPSVRGLEGTKLKGTIGMTVKSTCRPTPLE